MPVSISEAWWKDLWKKKIMAEPHARDTKVITAIKAYKSAMRGKKKGDVLDALDNLRDELFASVKRNLKRADLNTKQKDKLDFALADADALAESKRREVVKSGDAVKTIYNIDFGTVVNRVYKGKLVMTVSRPIEMKMMEVVIDELSASGADAMLYSEIDKLVEAAAGRFAARVDLYFNNNIGKIGKKEMDAFTKKTADDELQKLSDALERVPTDIMKKVRVHREIAHKYRKEKAIGIGRGVAGAALGVGGVFLPGTTAFAAVMAARSCAALAKEIGETVMSLKAKVKILQRTLGELESAYAKHKGEKEIARDAVNAVLGIDVIPTIGKAKGQLGDIEKDMKTTFHRARVANKRVQKALAAMDKVEAKIIGSPVSGIKKGALKMKVKLARRELDGLVDSVYRLMKHANYAEAKLPDLRGKLDEIGPLSGKVEKAKVAIRGAIAIGTSIAGMGDAGAATGLAKTAESVIANGVAFEGLMESVIDTMNEVNELA